MSGEEQPVQVPRRVCGWCGDHTGQTYVEVREHRPASYDGTYYCSYHCLEKAMESINND